MSTAARSLLSHTTARAIADGAARKSISSRSTSFALSRLISSSQKSQPSSFFQRCTTIHQPTKYSSSLLTGHNFSTAVAPDLDDAKEDSMQKAELIRRIKVSRYYIISTILNYMYIIMHRAHHRIHCFNSLKADLIEADVNKDGRLGKYLLSICICSLLPANNHLHISSLVRCGGAQVDLEEVL